MVPKHTFKVLAYVLEYPHFELILWLNVMVSVLGCLFLTWGTFAMEILLWWSWYEMKLRGSWGTWWLLLQRNKPWVVWGNFQKSCARETGFGGALSSTSCSLSLDTLEQLSSQCLIRWSYQATSLTHFWQFQHVLDWCDHRHQSCWLSNWELIAS